LDAAWILEDDQMRAADRATNSGGARQTVRRTNPTSAMPKSPGALTELVQTGLYSAAPKSLVELSAVDSHEKSGARQRRIFTSAK